MHYDEAYFHYGPLIRYIPSSQSDDENVDRLALVSLVGQ